jgi:uncharacterized membrane protein YkoI
MTMLRNYTIAAFTLALATAGTAAYAADATQNDALAINKAQISLSQAVTTAEQHVHGKASRAEYEDTKNGWAYDVEVVRDKKVFDVTVDAKNGAVIASTQDAVDHDDEHDETD